MIFPLLYLTVSLCNVLASNQGLNVGTVLFTKMDLTKPCWSSEEMGLLASRMIFEDLLPDSDAIHVDGDDFVDDLVWYFREVIELIRGSTEGRNRHVTLLALTDLLGGYLQHIVLPNAKLAFYAGVIDYASMDKLNQLFAEIKWFLRTNGEGWAKPTTSVNPPDCIQTLQMCESPNDSFSCEHLIYYDLTPAPTAKRQVGEPNIYFPLPFFDTKTNPSAIAIPFAHFSLRNIESRRSSSLIMKYFILAEKCLKEKGASKTSVERFQNGLYTWIQWDVIPKFHDEKFYAAFGNVLRVDETLKSLGASEITLSTEKPVDEAAEEVAVIPGESKTSRSRLIILIMLACILIWFLLGILFICYKIRSNKGGKSEKKAGGSPSSICLCRPTDSSKSSRMYQSGTASCRSCCSSSGRTGTTATTSDYDRKRSSSPDRYKKSSTNTSSLCICDECPAVLETSGQSMKILPSIAEISEADDRRSSQKKYAVMRYSESISTMERKSRLNPRDRPENRVCVPSLSSFSTKQESSRSMSSGRDLADPDCSCPFEAETSSTSQTEFTRLSLSSSVNKPGQQARPYESYDSEKPRIFGYDFHTSSSESGDDIDLEVNTVSSSK